MKGLEDEQPKALFLQGSQGKIKWFNKELKRDLLLAIMSSGERVARGQRNFRSG